MDSRRLSYTLNANDKNTIYNEDDNASIYFDPCISFRGTDHGFIFAVSFLRSIAVI